MDQRSLRPAVAPEPIDADHEPGGLVLVYPLIALAGWVAALGLVGWHGQFVPFMSGNSATLGTASTIGDGQGAWEVVRALLCFLLGTIIGEVIGPAARSWRGPAVVGTEAALLWLALAFDVGKWGGEAVTVAITGLAMGIQTAAVHKVDGTNVAMTYVTGTLVSLGRAVASALRGTAPWRKILPLATCWLAFVIGAIAGSVVARIATTDALAVAAAVASVTAFFSATGAVRRRRVK